MGFQGADVIRQVIRGTFQKGYYVNKADRKPGCGEGEEGLLPF